MDQLKISAECTSLSKDKLTAREGSISRCYAYFVSEASLLSFARIFFVMVSILSGNAYAQSTSAMNEGVCHQTCIHLRLANDGNYSFEVEIENVSSKSVKVAELGFLLSSDGDATHNSKGKLLYFSPVNVELGVPIYPLPSGSFPESSTILAARHSVRWQFKLSELRWAKAGEKAVRYGDWISVVKNGSYRLRAGIEIDSRPLKSDSVPLTKTER